ncbi:MAG: radical SAM protein [Bacteroidales bacterium]|nr:radical SAM protein [Bacteroidales bacterium]
MSKKQLDCLLIGPYEMSLTKREKLIKTYGTDSIAYRDLNLRMLHYNNKPYSFFDLLEMASEPLDDNTFGPFNTAAILSGAILYLGSFLDKYKLTFDYIKSFEFQREELARKLKEHDILTVVITTTTYLNPFPIKEIISFIRKYNKETKIIVGGPFVWTQINIQKKEMVDSMFKSIDADFYVHSAEGEAALVNIINGLKENENLNNVNNLYFKEDGHYVQTSNKLENNKLEENAVNWQLFYDDLQPHAWVRTSKSCAFQCSFCDSHIRLGKYQSISVDSVEKELNAIKKTGKIKTIRFIDDTFNIPKKRFKEILKMMIRNKYNFKWNSFFRCQYAEREIIELMVESGCEAVHLGIESADPKILINMNKQSTIEEYEKGLQLLNEYKIISFASFIIGFPGETEKTVNETISFIENSKPTFYLLWPWFCIPSTPIWGEKEKYNLTKTGFDWHHSTMSASQAMDYMENIILQVNNSVYCPFFAEYIGILLSKFTIGQIVNFSKAFNENIKKKIMHLEQKDVDDKIFDLFRVSLVEGLN